MKVKVSDLESKFWIDAGDELIGPFNKGEEAQKHIENKNKTGQWRVAYFEMFHIDYSWV